MASRTASDVLVETLLDWGVDTVFGLPGDGINVIIEALRTRHDKIRFIQVRHEEAAAFNACAYAKWTGSLGVCLATSGSRPRSRRAAQLPASPSRAPWPRPARPTTSPRRRNA